MSKLFVSYARENRSAIDDLVAALATLGHETWVDRSLHGGQDWWREILSRIKECDALLVVVSAHSLNSAACSREFEWAQALGKPVLPIAVDQLPAALPTRVAMLQIIDYSRHDHQAALALAGGLAALPPTPPLPDPLPEPPTAPLSDLTSILDEVSRPGPIDHERQREICRRLETASRSVDPEERQRGRRIAEILRSRDDMYADVDQVLNRLLQMPAETPAVVGVDDQRSTAVPVARSEALQTPPAPDASMVNQVGAQPNSYDPSNRPPVAAPEVRPGISKLAIASLVVGPFGILSMGILSAVGILLAGSALSRIERTGQRGRGLAIAGMALSIVSGVVFLGLVIFHMAN